MLESKQSILATGINLIPDSVLATIAERGFEVRRIRKDNLDSAALHRALNGVSGYLIGGEETATAAHFDAALSLKAVAFVGTDYRRFVEGWERAFELGIALTNCPGANAEAVAEFTILLILTMVRPFTNQIPAYSERAAPAAAEPGQELRGRTLGILGAGRIGARVASIASAFGMRVLYHAPRRNESLEHALGLNYVSMAELLELSEIITLHRPAVLEHGKVAIGEREFSRMQRGSVLINAGHPSLVDPVALLAAIRTRGIRSAFDGHGKGTHWDELTMLEPKQFLCVPSMAYDTSEANLRAANIAAESVCDILSGGESPLVRNPEFKKVSRALGRHW